MEGVRRTKGWRFHEIALVTENIYRGSPSRRRPRSTYRVHNNGALVDGDPLSIPTRMAPGPVEFFLRSRPRNTHKQGRARPLVGTSPGQGRRSGCECTSVVAL
jgi:hypothetical protein